MNLEPQTVNREPSMIPIYFPYTYLPEPLLHAFTACFKQLAVYQPSASRIPETLRTAQSAGHVEIRLPDGNLDKELSHLLKAYHAWGELHQGEPPDFEKFRSPEFPCWEDTSAGKIRAEIQNRLKGDDGPHSVEDQEKALLRSTLLYLTIAQEHDQYQESLQTDLDHIERRQKDLFRDPLASEERDDPAHQTISARYMTAEDSVPVFRKRTAAWSLLFSHHRQTARREAVPEDDPLVLLTPHSSALASLLEEAGGNKPLCRIAGIPFNAMQKGSEISRFRDHLSETIHSYMLHPQASPATDIVYPSGGEKGWESGLLTLYRVADNRTAASLFPCACACFTGPLLLGIIEKKTGDF